MCAQCQCRTDSVPAANRCYCWILLCVWSILGTRHQRMVHPAHTEWRQMLAHCFCLSPTLDHTGSASLSPWKSSWAGRWRANQGRIGRLCLQEHKCF
jgi:hypothetical protein